MSNMADGFRNVPINRYVHVYQLHLWEDRKLGLFTVV